MIAVWLEPTSTSKALRGLDPAVLGALDFISPNRYELQAIAAAVTGRAVEAHTVADVKALLALVRAIRGYRGWASLLSGYSCADAADAPSVAAAPQPHPALHRQDGSRRHSGAHGSRCVGTLCPRRCQTTTDNCERHWRWRQVGAIDGSISCVSCVDCRPSSSKGSLCSFCGGMVAALLRGLPLSLCVRAGLVAAHHSLSSMEPVGPTLTPVCQYAHI